MVETLMVTDVKFSGARADEVTTGLLGWVSFALGATLRLDGITLRRTADDRLTLSFPARRDAAGRQHAIIRPLDDAARRAIEAQIFAALGLEEVPL